MAGVWKKYNDIDYNTDIDYSVGIKEAEDAGDYELAASLEKARNAKIDGEGLSYAKTYKYQNAGGGQSSQDIYKKISSYGPFEYDYTKDPSYKALEAAYKANGKYAMQDTLGDAAALTGGRASTAAVSASQQAYNRYMQQLSENIPALEQAAYGRYQDQKTDLYNQYSILYSQERDRVSDQQWERSFGYTQERDKVSDQQWNQSFDYTKTQDAKQEAFEIGGITGDYSGLLEHGYSQEEVDALNQTGAKDEALKIAGITGDYSGLLQYGWSQETVDAVNAAIAKGVKKEEMAAALERAEIAATYGVFDDYINAGFDEETVAKMKAAYDKGVLTEEAILAAEFGDYSKLEALGITPKTEVDKQLVSNQIYGAFMEEINNGEVTYNDLKRDPGVLRACGYDEELYEKILAYAKETEERGNNTRYEAYVSLLYQHGSIDKLGATTTQIIQDIGVENYKKLVEIENSINEDEF